MSCTILCCDDAKKITQYTDIFKAHNLAYKTVKDISEIPFSGNELYIIRGFIYESFKINELKISFINSESIIKSKPKQRSSRNSSKSSFFR